MKKRGRQAPQPREPRSRLAVIATAVLLALPALAIWAPAPYAAAQGASAPWWGPTDQNDPTAGWAFRVPVVVRNPYDYPIDNWPVSVELDIGALLEDAGWTASDGIIQNFELDVDSIQVIRYDNSFTQIRSHDPVPHVFHPARLDTASGGVGKFNPATNPVGTVTFQLDVPDENPLKKGETLSYYIYFHGKQYEDRDPVPVPEKDRAALENLHGGGRGTVFYGYEQGAQGQANTLEIAGLHDETLVYLYTYTAGTPTLHSPQSGFKNPLPINASEFKRYVLPQKAFFKVEATKPIMVSSHGRFANTPGDSLGSYGSNFYVPSTDGGYRGTNFLFPAYAPHVWVVNTDSEAATVQMSGAQRLWTTESGSATVSKTSPVKRITDEDGVPVFQPIPSSSNPQRSGLAWYRITATNPVMVQLAGAMVPGVHAIPSAHGGARGTDFYSVVPQAGTDPKGTSYDGIYELGAFEDAMLRVIDPRKPGVGVFPQGSFSQVAPHGLAPGVENFDRFKANDTIPAGQSLRFWSTEEPAYLPDTGRGDFLLTAGLGPRIGHYLGHAGSEYVAAAPAAVIAYHNETRVTVTPVTKETCWWEGRCPDKKPTEDDFGKPQIHTLNQDRVAELPDPAPTSGKETRFLVTSDKPTAVVSREDADYYARFVPGRLPNPAVEVGGLEFRGPLVDLQSAGQTGQANPTAFTGPGRPVEFKLQIRNLGKWIADGDLTDTYAIKCANVDPGWTVEGCGVGSTRGPSIRLASGDAETFSVFVTPPQDAKPGVSTRITLTGESGLAGVKDEIVLMVTVKVEYGVGIWFGMAHASSVAHVYHDAGESEERTLVVKNLGSVRDTITVEAHAQNGWGATLTRLDTRETANAFDFTLDPDEEAKLLLTTTAPHDSPFANIRVTAETRTGAEAEATAKAAIKADLNFDVDLDRATKVGSPGESILFNVSVTNKGGDFLHFEFDVDESSIPENWTARFSETAIDHDANFTVQLNVTVPPKALAGELASLQLAVTASDGAAQGRELPAEARILVRHLHNLTIPSPDLIPVRPGRTLEHVLTLTNHGNGDEEVEVLRSSVRPFWPIASGLPQNLLVPMGETTQLPLEIEVPRGTPPGRVDLTFALRLNREAERQVTLPLDVLTVRELALEPRTSLRVTPGQAFAFEVEATNLGNVNGTYALEADVPPGWNASFEPAELTLAPGDGRIVTLRVNATRDAPETAFPLTLRARPDAEGVEPTETDVEVDVAKPTLAVGKAIAPGEPRRGELYVVRVPVQNAGTIDAVDVRVALRVDGEDVDVVTIGRIPAGAEKFATLKWEVDHSPDTMEVVVNPDGSVVTRDGEPVTAFLSVESRLIPTPGPLVAGLALLGAALVATRRRSQA